MDTLLILAACILVPVVVYVMAYLAVRVSALEQRLNEADVVCDHDWHYVTGQGYGGNIYSYQHCCKCGRGLLVYTVVRGNNNGARILDHGRYVQHVLEKS